MPDVSEYTLETIVDQAAAEMRGYLEDPSSAWTADRGDLAHGIADSATPAHTETLLRLALDNYGLATDEPEIMAFDGTNTAVNAIAGNVYDMVLQACMDECRRYDEEHEEEGGEEDA